VTPYDISASKILQAALAWIEKEGVTAKSDKASCGRLRIEEEGKSLKFDGILYNFEGKQRWEVVKLLQSAAGQFVKLPKGWQGTFDKGDALKFKKAAIEAMSKGSGGDGTFRLRP
jgi:hypothetical protein